MTTSGASTREPPSPAGSIVLLGRLCENTLAVANVLNDAGVALAAVIVAGRNPSDALVPVKPGPGGLAWASSPQAAHLLLQQLRPALVIAACYPWRVTRQTLALSRLGILNI